MSQSSTDQPGDHRNPSTGSNAGRTAPPSPTWALVRITAQNLRRDHVALVLTFVLPLIFFGIFASIFGNMGGGDQLASLPVATVDLDRSEASQRLLTALDAEASLDLRLAPTASEQNPNPQPYDEATAQRLVRGGRLPAALILPLGFGQALGSMDSGGEPARILYDAANPVARHTLSGLLQAAAMRASPDLWMERGLESLQTFGGPLTEAQRMAVDSFRNQLDAEGESGPSDTAASPFGGGLVPVEAIDVRSLDSPEDGAETDRPKRSMVAYYAAGIGVMFLLFSMTGAAGSLLEEEESGVLERLLSTRANMGSLLAGKWIFYGLLGTAQLLLMFAFGALAFGLELGGAKRLIGLLAMAFVTGMAASAFGLVLATLCRTRGQLSGVSTVVVLIMSAIGGSMFPRFLMPEAMNKAALLTFNGWALDGFLKIFWYDDPTAALPQALLDLVPQLAVLAAMTLAFLAVARRLARRWEAA